MSSVFASYFDESYPVKFDGTITFRESCHGGTPSNPAVAASWIKSKLTTTDEELKRMVEETMAARQINEAEAIKVVGDLRTLKGFKRDDKGLYLDGRTLKSCLKESCAVALAAAKVTNTRAFGVGKSGIKSFLPEHLFITNNKLYLLDNDTNDNVKEPTGIDQRFITTWRGTGVVYEEYVENAHLNFTLISDYLFEEQFYAMVWTTAEQIGLGASRSLSFGRFDLTRFDKVS